MKLKKIIITGAITAALGLGGYAGSGTINKTMQCTGQTVQIEVGENYYCGSLVEFNKDKEAFKTRLRDNKLIGKDDLGFGQLLIGSGDELQNEIATILITKYDKNNKEFYGLDSDFIDQMWLATELANIKCAGECQLVGETLTEQIYNILIK